VSSDPRRGRSKRTANSSKVHPIKPDDSPMDGLPCNVDAERFVLGWVLLGDERFSEIGALTPGDFTVERHRRIFDAMRELHDAGDGIDRVTLDERLIQRNEHCSDDFAFLLDLDSGIPQVPHVDSWVRILREKNILRRAILESHKFMKECALRTAEPAEMLAAYQARMEALNAEWSAAHGEIRRIEDLESVFADRLPTEYVIEPELPAKAIVCLAGDSESGKTTLACAWARDALLRGHAVLLLDRDRNPRERVRDRLERLGISADCKLLWVWDCEQKSEPPQPDDPIVVDWVKRMVAETGKPPLVILDSLISFFLADEDENAAVDMRALFDRCRALTGLGATVIAIHHTNRNGEARGSSDFKPACDQAFLVTNHDRDGGRLLDVVTLKYEKSRYGFSGTITYHYADGKMLRIETGVPGKHSPKSPDEQLRALLIANPGILTDDFVKLAQNKRLKRETAREFLKNGESDGSIRVEAHGRSRRQFWQKAEAGINDQDP
jgi:archaellum biogenesis ATPase FlaH